MAYGRGRNQRRKGRERLMRMLGSATSARGDHIRKTRAELKKDLELKARQRRAAEQRDYDKRNKWSWLGRGLGTAMKVGSMLATGGATTPWVVGGALAGGIGGALMPEGADPYVQQGLAATQSLMGHQQQMDLLDRQLANQERYTSSILQGLQRGGGRQYGTGQSFSAQGYYGQPPEPPSVDLGTIGRRSASDYYGA